MTKQDFAAMPTKPEWLFTSLASHVQKDESQDSHGSCVASKAAGHRFGVSKSSVLVIVKAGLDDASTIEALALAQSDIITKKRQGRAVLIFARASDPPTPPGGLAPAVPWDSVRDLMDDLTMLDVPIVVPSGNDGIKSVDRVPALWATPQFGSMPLLVTGAVDTEGVQSKFSQGSLRDGFVWAPGTNVQCANGAVGDTTRSGTSFAASMVHIFPMYSLTFTDPRCQPGGWTCGILPWRFSGPLLRRERPDCSQCLGLYTEKGKLATIAWRAEGHMELARWCHRRIFSTRDLRVITRSKWRPC